MGRIRTIKPEFFKHERLFDLEMETKFPIRIAFAGLWTCVDRAGRFEWRPRMLKTEILPYDNLDFTSVLDALTTRGFVIKYQANNREYGFIPSFNTHQVINNRERDSILPQPPDNIEEIDASSMCPPRVTTKLKSALGEQGKEGKGKEQGKEGNVTCHVANAPDDIQTAFDSYNLIAQELGLPLAQVLSDQRKAALRKRLKECGGLEGWHVVLNKLGESAFLCGEKTDFKCTLDFIITKSKFIRIMEGNYNDRYSSKDNADHETARRRKAIATGMAHRMER